MPLSVSDPAVQAAGSERIKPGALLGLEKSIVSPPVRLKCLNEKLRRDAIALGRSTKAVATYAWTPTRKRRLSKLLPAGRRAHYVTVSVAEVVASTIPFTSASAVTV